MVKAKMLNFSNILAINPNVSGPKSSSLHCGKREACGNESRLSCAVCVSRACGSSSALTMRRIREALSVYLRGWPLGIVPCSKALELVSLTFIQPCMWFLHDGTG